MRFEIETERLTLRYLHRSDVLSLVKYMAEPESQPFLLRSQKNSLIIEQGLLRRCDLMFQASRLPENEGQVGFDVAIVLSATGTVIGSCTLYPEGKNTGEARFGMHISTAYAGCGYATEVGLAMLHFAFKRLMLTRVQADCFFHHSAMIRVLEKLGMRRSHRISANPWYLRWRYREFRRIVRHEIWHWGWRDEPI